MDMELNVEETDGLDFYANIYSPEMTNCDKFGENVPSRMMNRDGYSLFQILVNYCLRKTTLRNSDHNLALLFLYLKLFVSMQSTCTVSFSNCILWNRPILANAIECDHLLLDRRGLSYIKIDVGSLCAVE